LPVSHHWLAITNFGYGDFVAGSNGFQRANVD
jgi:hypothetical protein